MGIKIKKTAFYVPEYMMIMRHLISGKEIAFPTIPKDLGTDSRYVYRIIISLAKEGYVKKTYNNQQASFYSLTDKGSNVAIAIDALLEELGINDDNIDMHRERYRYKIPEPNEPDPGFEIKEKDEEKGDFVVVQTVDKPKTALDELEDELAKSDTEFREDTDDMEVVEVPESDKDEEPKEIIEFIDLEEEERNPYGDEE